MTAETREKKVAHFVDRLLELRDVPRDAVDHVALYERLLAPASPTKRHDRQAAVDDVVASIRASFGDRSAAQGDAAARGFLAALQSLDNAVAPEAAPFLDVLAEIHANPHAAKLLGARYDFSAPLNPARRISPARSPVRRQFDSDAHAGASPESRQPANMGREGAPVLGNSAAANQRATPVGVPLKRALNFATGQKAPAPAPPGGSARPSRTSAELPPVGTTVPSLRTSVSSTAPRGLALSRASESVDVLRRSQSEARPAGLSVPATGPSRDSDGGSISRSHLFGNISSIQGASADATPDESRRASTNTESRPSYSITRHEDHRSAVDSGYRTMSQIHSRISENVPPPSLGATHTPSYVISADPEAARPPVSQSPRRLPPTATSTASSLAAPAFRDTPPSPNAARAQRMSYSQDAPSERASGDRLPRHPAFSPAAPEEPRAQPRFEDEFSPASSVGAVPEPEPTPAARHDPARGVNIRRLGSMPLAEQERLVVDDLLYVLLGFNGIYIRAAPKQRPRTDDLERPERMEVFQLEKRDGAWEMDATMDASLASMVKLMLPVAKYYQKLQNFVKNATSMEAGRISNAVAAAVRGLLKEYLLLVVQLETLQRQGQLSLQKLFYHVNPTLRTMRTLQEIASAIINPPPQRKGCQLVSLLERRLAENAGDPVGRALHTTLLRASLPSLVHQIREWIYKGQIRDDGGEFFVAQAHNMSNAAAMTEESWGDEVWTKFTVVDENVPPLFDGVKEKILDAGRNWDMVRVCGKKVGVPRAEIEAALAAETPPVVGSHQLIQTLGIAGIFSEIEFAFTSANAAMLDLLVKENNLMARLRSMKRYFLLDSADFLVQFLDLASEELSRRSSEVSVPKLQNLWDLCTAGETDSFEIEISKKSFLNVVLRIIAGTWKQPGEPAGGKGGAGKISDPGVVVGFDGFVLAYRTKFPLSLMFNFNTVFMYRTLFRHLFNCKHVENLLATGWQEQAQRKFPKRARPASRAVPSPGRAPPPDGFAEFARFELRMGVLRHQMLGALRQVMAYMSLEVIERRFKLMELRILGARTVRDVLQIHEDFLLECCKECMISEEPVIDAFSRVMYIVSTFCSFSNWFTQQMRMVEAGPTSLVLSFNGTYSLPGPLLEGDSSRPPSTPLETLEALGRLYRGSMRDLIEAIKGATEGCPQLGKLAQRLDFDGFYMEAAADDDAAAMLDTPEEESETH